MLGELWRHCFSWGLCVFAVWLLSSTATGQTEEAGPPVGALITNEVTVAFKDASGNPRDPVTATVVTEVASGPLLVLGNDPLPSLAEVGDLVSFVLRYENQGNGPASSVELVDELSVNSEFVSATGGGVYDPATHTVRWPLGTVAANSSGQRIVETRVLGFDAADTLSNTATVSSAEGSRDTAETVVNRGSGAVFFIEKAVDRPTTFPGGVLVYSVTLANTGSLAASGVRVIDDLPAGTSLVPGSVTLPYTIDGQRLTVTIGDLAVREMVSFEFAVNVSTVALPGTNLVNQAVALATGVDPVASAPITTRVLDAGEVEFRLESLPSAVYAGSPIVFRLTVVNNKATALQNLSLEQEIPDQTSFISIDNGGAFDGTTAQWSLASLDPGESTAFEWTVAAALAAPANMTILSSATLDADGETTRDAQASTLVLERTTAAITYYDSGFSVPVGVYYDGETTAFIEVVDDDQNTDDAVIERIQVAVTNVDSSPSSVIAPLSTPLPDDLELIELVETSSFSGVFRGSIDFEVGTSTPGNGLIAAQPGSAVFTTYEDPVDGTDLQVSAALYQPATVVFNSVTGDVIEGATVTLLNEDGTPPSFVGGGGNRFVTDVDGLVAIPELVIPASGSVNLRFEVEPPAGSEFVFPSVVPDGNFPDQLSTGKVPEIEAGSRGDVFTLTSVDAGVAFDLPLDIPTAGLRVEKTSRNNQIAIGEIITYEIRIINASLAPVTGIQLIDQPPKQFRYLEGSSSLGGSDIADPIRNGRELVWPVIDLGSAEEVTLTYRMMVGVDAREGLYQNSAYATGSGGAGVLTSNIGRHEARVTEGIFSRKGLIVGRVYIDLNGNARYDPGEPGVPEAFVYLQDGSYAITDSEGRYSMKNIRPGQHVLRLDDHTLPEEMVPAGWGGHFMDRADSQWVEMHASGLLKANFPVIPANELAREQIIAGLNRPDEATEIPETIEDVVESVDAVQAAGLAERTRELEALAAELESGFGFVNLRDRQQLAGRYTDIQVRVPLGASVRVELNGREVDGSRLGARIQSTANQIELQEFVGVRLRPDTENRIRATLIDPFGNERETEELRVYTLAQLERFELSLPEQELEADGRTVTRIEARLIDSRGSLADYVSAVTVDARPAYITNEDIDAVNPGHQVKVVDGVARIDLRAPRKPGPITVYIQSDDVTVEAELNYKPHLRELMVVGSGQVMLGSSNVSGDIGKLNNVFDDEIEDGTNTDADVAFFAKGDIGNDILLTATFDSDKAEQDDFFQARETNLDEESHPSLTGDGSVVDYEGYSRDPLYLRLDRGDSNAMWDYRTELGEDQLSFYNRTYTGFRSELNEGIFSVTTFAAEMEQDQIVDALPARGVSGYYYLSRSPLVYGSERVVVETRDRLRPDLVLERRELIRNEDYEIDYYTGSLLSYAPIPSYDGALNPNFIVVTYEVDNETNDNWAYGGRAEAEVAENVTLGGTYVNEEGELGDFTLQGVDVAYEVESIQTTLKAEYVHSESVVSEQGLFKTEDGDAYRLSFEGTPAENLEVSGYYQTIDEYFVNRSATNVRNGTTTYGADARYALDELNRVYFDAYREDDRLYKRDFTHIGAGWEGLVNQFTLGAEVYHDAFNGESTSYDWDDPNNGYEDNGERYPFDSTPEQISQDLGLKLSAETYLMDALTLGLSHSQDMTNIDQSLSYARLGYEFTEGRRLYLTERYDRYEDRDELRTVFGFEAPVGSSTTRFIEYQFQDDSTSQYLKQSVGVRHQYNLTSKLTGNASFENLTTLNGESGANRPDGYAVTLANTFLASEYWRFDSRLEYRDETGFESRLAEVNCSGKINEEMSTQFRVRYYDSEGQSAGTRDELRFSWGYAYRPIFMDRFHALARFDWATEERTGGQYRF